MKNIVRGSLLLLAASVVVVIFQFVYNTGAIANSKIAIAGSDTDSVALKILTKNLWKVDKLHHVINGVYSEYTDGGKNSTGIPYEKLRFRFNVDGTGVHTDQNGNDFEFEWKLSQDQRSLTIKVNFGIVTEYTWDMLEISGNYLHASVNLTVGGNSNNIETFRLIQISGCDNAVYQ